MRTHRKQKLSLFEGDEQQTALADEEAKRVHGESGETSASANRPCLGATVCYTPRRACFWSHRVLWCA